MTLNVTLVTPEDRPLALRLLFARFPVEEQASRLSDALKSVERGCLNLDGLLLAQEADRPVGAALMMRQMDGVALVWPPVITCQTLDVAAAEDALMTRLCEEIDRSGAKLAQALIAPDNIAETELLERHGFELAAEMFFLARQLADDDIEATEDNAEIDHELFNELNAVRYASAIDLTYQQSLDCSFLDGFRTGKDALLSHRLSGVFDPAGWRLYRSGTEDIGVMLMNEHPEQDAIELVYFGIVPQFRGRRLGRKMLQDGLQAAALTGRAVMFLAVDCGNTYANAVYNQLGFAELARRKVMLRRCDQVARE